MRRFALIVLMLAVLAPFGARADATTILTVDNGDTFYDTNKDCVGDTDTPTGAEALRHWHVGIPFAPALAEAAGGFGCLGGPKEWAIVVPAGARARIAGSVRYTWDTNVPGGCCNDVHIHITNAAGDIVASTLLSDGPKPVIPQVAQPQSHAFDFPLSAGAYTIVEDVFSGEHTAWLTKLAVTLS